MKENVSQVKTQRPRAPNCAVNQVAQNEERPEETALSLTPNHRPITAEDFSYLSKIIGKEIRVDGV